METRIEKVECWVLRAPIAEPVANAFGAMTNRPAVFLRITASDGAWGWGEVFSNFPQVGAEHRARLVAQPLRAAADRRRPPTIPRPCARCSRRARGGWRSSAASPGPSRRSPARSTRRCGTSRRAAPGFRCGSTSVAAIACASTRAGIGPDRVGEIALAKRAEGYRAFKLKVGIRHAARRREPRRDARGARRRRDDHVRREPGVDAGRRARAHRGARAVPPALDRGADRRGRAARGVARGRAGKRDPARGRREPARRAGVRRRAGGGVSRLRAAGRRQVGRHQRRTRRRAAGGRARRRVLPALARRRRRARGVDARARRERQRERLRRGRRESESAARRGVPARDRRRLGDAVGRAGAGRRAGPRAAPDSSLRSDSRPRCAASLPRRGG